MEKNKKNIEWVGKETIQGVYMTKEMKYLKSDFAQQSPDKNYKEFVKWSLKNKTKKKIDLAVR